MVEFLHNRAHASCAEDAEEPASNKVPKKIKCLVFMIL